jgi:hypothetical protein
MNEHVANETGRLYLRFTMQNCPGWAMSGGPWITPEKPCVISFGVARMCREEKSLTSHSQNISPATKTGNSIPSGEQLSKGFEIEFI